MSQPVTPDLHLGLIGYPLSHSLSPHIHTAALRACGLRGDYSLFPILPGDDAALQALLVRLRSGKLHGLNVTIPHKQHVIQYLDELTPTAKSIGAVNTIYWRDGKLIGENTDAMGFITDLKTFFGAHASSIVNPRSSIVLGAGGSARAIVYALLNDGWRVTIASRRQEQAQQLANNFTNDQVQLTTLTLSNTELSNVSLIVNTTPLGMTPNTEQSPWPQHPGLPAGAAIYDLVYNPAVTKLVRDARAQGRPAVNGIGMLIEQAALSFEIWTGKVPPRDVMRSAIEQSPVSNYHLPITNSGAY